MSGNKFVVLLISMGKKLSTRHLYNLTGRDARKNPIANKIIEKPKLNYYGLVDSDVEFVKEYNLKQEKLKSKFYKLVWLVIGIACFLALFDYFKVLRYVWLLILFVPFNFLIIGALMFILGGISEIIYKKHRLTDLLEKYNKDNLSYESYLRTQERAFWLSLSGHEFEQQIGILLRSYFEHVEITKGSGDGGVDIILYDQNLKIIIQCKNHKNKIGPEPVRAIKGVLNNFKAHKAVVISTNGYTPGSLNFVAENKSVYLYDLEDVIAWTKAKDVGYINFAGKKYRYISYYGQIKCC
jgi:HJR/Mrr/RecB family endonuclease